MTDETMDDHLWAPRSGRFGQTRDGRLVALLLRESDGRPYPWTGTIVTPWQLSYKVRWNDDGRAMDLDSRASDLVCEWGGDAGEERIDQSAIRPGDDITVRLKVRDMDASGRPICLAGNAQWNVEHRAIVAHTPPKLPVQIGCKVAVDAPYDQKDSRLLGEHQVVGIDGDVAWIKRSGVRREISVGALTRYDAEVA